MIRTEETVKGKSLETLSLKSCRMTENTRCAAPAKKYLNRWADETRLRYESRKIDLNLSGEQDRKIGTTKRYLRF